MARPDISMPEADVHALLKQPLTGVFSTIGPGGFPHSVGIFYLPSFSGGTPGARLWVYAKSQKVKNVERDPRCALLVERGRPYDDLQGVLLRGHGKIVREAGAVEEAGRALYQRYFFRRTGVPLDEGPDAEIARQSTKRVVIAITPERIASWDHSRGPSLHTSR